MEIFFPVLEPRPSSPEKRTQRALVPAEFLPLPCPSCHPIPTPTPPPSAAFAQALPRPGLRRHLSPSRAAGRALASPRNSGPRGFGGNPQGQAAADGCGQRASGLGGTEGKMQGEAVLSTPGSGGFGLVFVPLRLPSSPSPLAGVRAVSTRSLLPSEQGTRSFLLELCLYPLTVAALTWCVALEMKGPFRSLEPRLILLLTHLPDPEKLIANSALQAFSSVKWEA